MTTKKITQKEYEKLYGIAKEYKKLNHDVMDFNLYLAKRLRHEKDIAFVLMLMLYVAGFILGIVAGVSA